MGFLNSLIGGLDTRSSVDPKHPRDPLLAAWFGGDNTVAGASVTPDTAMRVGAVYACVALIAETIAALPLHVYRDEGDRTSKARDHPLYPLLHDMPSTAPALTSFEWREAMVGHTALRGDAYALIEQRQDGQIVGLPPLHPDTVRPERGANGRVRFIWQPGDGPRRVLLDDEVLRIPHKLMDGVTSLSPIALHRETVGVSLASQRYLAAFYRNSAQPKGGLKVPTEISNEAAQMLRASWEQRHQGPENASRIAIFDGGLEWQSIGMNNDDAQYVELQKLSVADIARIYLVPPHKIGELSNATFSNIEHQAIEFVTDTILRWVRRLENRMDRYLLSARDRAAGVYIGFDLKGLLRGDAAARAAFYKALFYLGAMSPNEIRGAEDMNPYEGGERYYLQGATIPIDQVDAAMMRRVPGNREGEE